MSRARALSTLDGTIVALAPAPLDVTSANALATLKPFQTAYCDSSGGNLTPKLPASPQAGWICYFIWKTGINTVTVDNNGSTIEGVNQTIQFDSGYLGRLIGFQYKAGTWKILGA